VRCWILLGGNMGEVKHTMLRAVDMLVEILGNPLVQSGYYQSEPWGFDAKQLFINQVLEFETRLLPLEVLDLTQKVERQCGRLAKTNSGYESRYLDIDLLFVDALVIAHPRLEVPHPRLHLRRFTLLPLAEKWPELIHPLLNLSVAELLKQCSDDSQVSLLSEH